MDSALAMFRLPPGGRWAVPLCLLDCGHTVMMAVWGMNCTAPLSNCHLTSSEDKFTYCTHIHLSMHMNLFSDNVQTMRQFSVSLTSRFGGHLGLCFVLRLLDV